MGKVCVAVDNYVGSLRAGGGFGFLQEALAEVAAVCAEELDDGVVNAQLVRELRVTLEGLCPVVDGGDVFERISAELQASLGD